MKHISQNAAECGYYCAVSTFGFCLNLAFRVCWRYLQFSSTHRFTYLSPTSRTNLSDGHPSPTNFYSHLSRGLSQNCSVCSQPPTQPTRPYFLSLLLFCILYTILVLRNMCVYQLVDTRCQQLLSSSHHTTLSACVFIILTSSWVVRTLFNSPFYCDWYTRNVNQTKSSSSFFFCIPCNACSNLSVTSILNSDHLFPFNDRMGNVFIICTQSGLKSGKKNLVLSQ